MKYEFHTTIRYSQTGCDEHLALTALVDFFQDAAIESANELQKAAPPELMGGLVWFLAAWQIDVKRYPVCGERVVIGTFPYRFRGSMGLRNLYLRTEDGEMLAQADSTWVLMNRESGTMTKVPEWLSSLYEVEEPLPMDYKGRHIAVPASPSTSVEVPVNESGTASYTISLRVKREQLDSNYHVNNGQYVRMAMRALGEFETATPGMEPPADFVRGLAPSYARLRVEYKKPAVLGDLLELRVLREPARDVVVICCAEDVCAVAECTCNTGSGEV